MAARRDPVPRLIAKYVRQEKVLTLEDAVRKASSAVATRLQLTDRGVSTVGLKADVIVFDPATIKDNATFEKPHQLSTGVRDMFVNSVAVLRNGAHTGANVAYNDAKRGPQPVFYLPWMQQGIIGQMYFYTRTRLAADQLIAAIGPMMRRIDAALPVQELKTMPQQLRENVFLDRMISILSAAFALLATLLAAVGLYGVLAYSVSQRTREIGVRMALGPDRGRVQGMVLRQVAAMVAVGATVGALGAFALGRAARSLLFGLEGHDPVVFAFAVILLAAVAFGAGWLPARRASRTQPMMALRYD